MLSSLSNLSWMQRAGSHQPALNLPTKQKTEPPPTGLQALVEDGPPRLDGSDKFFGMENVVGFGNTCYCNSILQCLYYSKPFRENVVNFPYRAQLPNQSNSSASSSSNGRHLSRVNTEPIPTISSPTGISRNNIPRATAATKGDLKKPGNLPVTANLTNNPMGPENKDTSEAKKKQALLTGPVLNIDHSNNAAYGMEENLFSGLKDIFETIMGHESRTGVVNPTKFLEILRRENDMFSGQQHQDAHEFLNYVLNQVIENVDDYQKKHGLKNGNGNLVAPPRSSGSLTPINSSSAASTASMTSTSATGWIHELFEGLLSSETKCLTCENVSRRDEQFLDLSIDLEKNSSVTSCLRNFSASEMLCERNKFHCDTCGGLQEAEKRMKIKRLPKVLALHLKRFKFMEHLGRFEKLHYRVLYPYHLRLFNTTDDADDPDRLYELYAVVVHIGGGPYHGHYVAIVKTEDKGWLLFDDELVEPVDKTYVRNFFGERPGMACAYVLFYQETTLEAVQREQWAEEQQAEEAARAAAEAAKTDSAKAKSPQNGGIHVNGHANRGEPKESSLPPLHISNSEPPRSSISVEPNRKPAIETEPTTPGTPGFIKSRKEKEKERREEKEREKAGKVEKGDANNHGMNRFRNTSKSFRGPPKWLGGDNKGKKGKERNASLPHENGDTPPLPPLPPTPALPTSPVIMSPVQPPVEEKKELNGTNGSLGKLEEPEKGRAKELEKEQKENEGHSPVEHKEDAKETKETKEEKKDKKEKELEKLREKADKKKDKETKAKHRTSFFGLRKKASIALNAGGGD